MLTEPVVLSLVQMPWASPRRPSIALGILASVADEAGIKAQTWYGNVDLCAVLGSDIPDLFATSRHLFGLSEHLWAVDIFGREALCSDAFLDAYAASGSLPPGLPLERLVALRDELLPRWLDQAAARILDDGPAAVALSATFNQTLACLAMARRLKNERPDLLTLFGGACFEGEMGRAYHEALPEIVDHVCLGEGEAPFRAALERLKRGQDLSRIPGLTWAKEGAVQPATGTILQDLSQSPMPDYTAYFSAVEALRTSTGVSLSLDFLPFESSRGCWWGQRNHCVFCGLNTEVLPFRAKQAETVVEEILTLTRRYGTTRLLATDWIMSRQHRIEVLKPLAEQEIDLDIFYESRVDLTRSDFHALHGAGVRRVQPGIEALSTPLLKLMRKHTSGLRQVQFLRWCLEFGIDPVYNLLSGFPGEEAAWYAETAALVPLLVHLPPPRRNLITVEMHRFSPLFRERERFAVREIRPRADYRYNFPPGVIDLTRSCYFFEYDSDALPDPGEEHAALEAAIDAWLSAHRGPRPPRCELRVGPGFVEIIVLDEPAVVVAVLEVEEGHPKVFDSFKRPQPQQLLLQRLDESLRNPVAFGLADEGGAGRDPEELHLGLEIAAGVLAAVVMSPVSGVCERPGNGCPEEESTYPSRFAKHRSPANGTGLKILAPVTAADSVMG